MQSDLLGSQCDAPVPESGESQDKRLDMLLTEDKYPKGSQYEGEQPSSEEYNDSSPLSEDEKPIYIQAMNNEWDPSMNLAPTQLKDTDWRSHREIIRNNYQRSPLMPRAIWEFTP